MIFGEKLFQTKLLSRLSHKVCHLLSSPVLLRKFTIEKNTGFSICTRSDLNKNREETIKKHDLIDGSNHAKRTKNGHLEMVPVFQFFTHFSGLSRRRTKTGPDPDPVNKTKNPKQKTYPF